MKAQTTAIQQQISWGKTMQQMNASTNRRENVDIEVPKTVIPAFSSDQLGWTQFWARSKTAVHDKTSLSATQKFNILEPLLFGKARMTVINLVPSEASYNEAITKLLAMYDDKEAAIDQHLAGLNNLPSVDHEHDLDGLLNLQFSIVTHINGLRTLGVAEATYGAMLGNAVIDKLPAAIRKAWATNRTNRCEIQQDYTSLSTTTLAR